MSDILFGRISFEISDGFTELFLSECKREDISLKNVRVRNNIITATVNRHELKRVYAAAKKSGNSVKILKRYGLPDFLIRYRKRLGIPCGILLFALILGFLGSFVWSVDIAGLESIPAEEIERVLYEAGIKKGALYENLQCKDAEYILYNEFPEISWVNVLPIGSRVFVTVKERTELSADDGSTYSNIIASKDGEIVRADIFVGDGFFYPGSAVEKGELLASGVINFRDGRVRFVDCEAVVLARTKNRINSFAPVKIEAWSEKKCKDNYFLYFFGLKVPLNLGVKGSDFTENGYFFDTADIIFPIGLIRRHYSQLNKKEINLSPSQAKLIAFFDFAENAVPLYESAEILERNITFSQGNVMSFEGSFLCVEDIAEKKIFTVNEREADLR